MRGTITVKGPNTGSGEPPKTFTFDTVFDTNCKQVDIYNKSARPIVDCVLEGYNGECLQPSSDGKVQEIVQWTCTFQIRIHILVVNC